MKKYLKEYLQDTFIIETQGAGLSININPSINLDMDKLQELALQNKIKLYFTNDITNNEWQSIRMGFGGFEEEYIQEAIQEFSKIWYKCITVPIETK